MTLHRAHLIADLFIGIMAAISLVMPETWSFCVTLDVIFHIAILVVVIAIVASEKILHKHSGTISE